jgi:hypothetical protein
VFGRLDQFQTYCRARALTAPAIVAIEASIFQHDWEVAVPHEYGRSLCRFMAAVCGGYRDV